jgi:hypothetical protein
MIEDLKIQLAGQLLAPMPAPEDDEEEPKAEGPRRREVLFYSGSTVERFDFWTGESWNLRFDMDSADLSALSAGAPVLDGHQIEQTEYVIGVVESARRADDGFRAVLRFSNREDVNGLWQDIQDGILRNVSMGVQIGELLVESKPGAEVRQYLARNWKPYEISVVPIGADPKAKILSTSLTAAPSADQQRAQYELALRQRRWRVLGK